MESETNAADASVDRVVMPSLSDLRGQARAMLELANEIELAKCLIDGDRIGSYPSYAEWLQSGRNGKLYLKQAIECLLFDLAETKDKAAMSDVVRSATRYLLDL